MDIEMRQWIDDHNKRVREMRANGGVGREDNGVDIKEDRPRQLFVAVKYREGKEKVGSAE